MHREKKYTRPFHAKHITRPSKVPFFWFVFFFYFFFFFENASRAARGLEKTADVRARERQTKEKESASWWSKRGLNHAKK